MGSNKYTVANLEGMIMARLVRQVASQSPTLLAMNGHTNQEDSMRSVEERLARHSLFISETGCIVWTGHKTPNGYGVLKVGGKWKSVHRLAYEQAYGPIPDGLVIDHLCRVKPCKNPDHLEAVSSQTNILRGVGITAKYAARTHCKRGHALTDDNIYNSPVRIKRGERLCKLCHKLRRKKGKE